MAAIELLRQDPAPREPGDVRGAEAERGEERRQRIGVPREAEILRRVRRATDAGLVPCDDRELVGQLVELVRHTLLSVAVPWRKTIGGPSPERRYAISRPLTSIVSIGSPAEAAVAREQLPRHLHRADNLGPIAPSPSDPPPSLCSALPRLDYTTHERTVTPDGVTIACEDRAVIHRGARDHRSRGPRSSSFALTG